jgi:hypothetical protein
MGGRLPNFAAVVQLPSIAALSTNPEIDVMYQQQTVAFGAIRQLPKHP